MLFKKYHIVIFKEDGQQHRNLHLRGWLGAGLFLLVAALTAGNIYLWQFYAKSKHYEERLTTSEKLVEEQNGQLLNMPAKLRTIQTDLSRVQQFDAKLRLMMNLDTEPFESTALGGPGLDDFSKGYLPLHRQELLTRKMHTFIKQLDTDIHLEEVQQQELLRTIRDNREVLSATPSTWPTQGLISSSFGRRGSPFTGRGEFHKGIDITAKRGTPIQSTAKGVVSFAGSDGSYGNTVIINHGNGLVTRYSHMQRCAVKEGDSLSRGDLVGYVGNTGRSTGPHLHYEVILNGVCVNPMHYILN